MAVSPVTIADGTPGWFGLGPVAIAPAWQRRGHGTRLVAEALEELRARGAAGCVLCGDPAFYGRFGFRALPRLLVGGVPPQYVLALAWTGPTPAGVVDFHPAFGIAAAPAPDA